MAAQDVRIEITGLREFQQLVQKMEALQRSSKRTGGSGGPVSNLASAQANANIANASGDPIHRADAAYRLERAMLRMQRIQQSQDPRGRFGEAIGQLIRSTRFGGNGVMPLVGRSMDAAKAGAAALGGEEFAAAVGKAAGPLGTVVALFAGLAIAARDAIPSLTQFRNATLQLGSSTGTTAFLKTLGVDPGDAAGFRQNVQSGVGAAELMRLGISPPGDRRFGAVDEGKLLQDAIERVAALPTRTARIQSARNLGIEQYLPQIEGFHKNPEQARRDAELSARVNDSFSQDAATSASHSLDRIGKSFENFKNALGGGAGIMIAPALDTLTAFVDNLTKGLLGIQGRPVGSPDVQSGVDPQTKALDRNTQATLDLAKLYEQGLFGGGNAAAGALPGAYRGAQFEQFLQGNTVRLGIPLI